MRSGPWRGQKQTAKAKANRNGNSKNNAKATAIFKSFQLRLNSCLRQSGSRFAAFLMPGLKSGPIPGATARTRATARTTERQEQQLQWTRCRSLHCDGKWASPFDCAQGRGDRLVVVRQLLLRCIELRGIMFRWRRARPIRIL